LDAFAASGREGITFARSASPPCAGLSTFWAGDQAAQWQYLPALIRAGLGAAVAGFPFWGHDIGGYSGTPSQELYVRWLQFGTFAPIMQLHGITPREPWHFGARAESIARTCFQVRERLLPYLVATASNIYSHGIPIMRPMAWVYPQHEEAWAVNDAYLLGDALLVAPVVTPVPREPIPAALLRTPDGSPGLQCEFFANTACAGKPAAVEQMPQVDCNWGQGSAWDPQITDRFSARWQGTLGPIPTAGVYTIIVACDDGARLWVDDKLVIDEWQDRPLGEYAVQLEFSQGQRCPVRLEYYEQSGDAVCRLLWREPGQDRVARSVWLPPGTWVDAWTGDRHAGPGRITRMTPLEEIPVYIRAPRYDALRDIFVTADHHKREPSHD
jgi:alpha-D-xyloside xylohydrolase